MEVNGDWRCQVCVVPQKNAKKDDKLNIWEIFLKTVINEVHLSSSYVGCFGSRASFHL